ncbi:hypothetical protein [Laribacter hongkongensis]|nr:hypothetical protein [Laribacter hongkongensis]MCG9033255.1 hypothetical protein [Laribacter hongkongensis]MCG9093338.1 hypothetical protein [Laribacter hongkongensis]
MTTMAAVVKCLQIRGNDREKRMIAAFPTHRVGNWKILHDLKTATVCHLMAQRNVRVWMDTALRIF